MANSLQIVAITLCVVNILFGAILAYVSYQGIKGKIKPNGAVGVRLSMSRNYKLYQKEKYWYPLNRYGGEKTIYVTVAWTLLSLIITVLPIDPLIKIYALNAILILWIVALAGLAWHLYRYGDKLVSGDPAYR